MDADKKNILLMAMPFAGIAIPSIQLAMLEGYLKEHETIIKTEHLYLKAAEFYGINNYNMLITKPNESYTTQMVFSKYVFPEHWKKNEHQFREYFKKITTSHAEFQKNFTFDEYVEKTDHFYNWVIENTNWKNYDIIGFTLNYGQFLPSLAIAKKIKEIDQRKKIVFGGSRTSGEIGKRVLAIFDIIDFIVDGDGEEPLLRLVRDYNNLESIPNLTYKKDNKIFCNPADYFADLNSLPIPSYDSFYENLDCVSYEVKQFFYYSGRSPVEISRGCWWNKCTFCNHNIKHPCYREKNVKRIVEELEFLSDKYKMLNFQIIGNTLPKEDYKLLFEEIKKLNKDFNFFVEARSGQLKSDDYRLMDEAGFRSIQTGIESFSKSYLEKMKKGVRVIDNIAALKYCKEYDIRNEYNLIINYPNEDKMDFEETKKNIQLIEQYLDPPNMNNLLVGVGSYIFTHPDIFNIENFDYTDIDKVMFPRDILEKEISFYYNFKTKNELDKNDWIQIVDEWRLKREELETLAIKKKTLIDKLIFYFVDGGSFIKIYDKRDRTKIQIYVLDESERKIFLACMDVTSYNELRERLIDIDGLQLTQTLSAFEQCGIVFHEDDRYLSLPLRCNIKLVNQPVKEEFMLVSD